MKARILLLSDEPLDPARLNADFFKDVDLIISCGDLPAHYLSLIADLSCRDVLYVHGNHDAHYLEQEPLGCICIDDRIVDWHGIRIMGLGGSAFYNGSAFQYTQDQMNWRTLKLISKNLFRFRKKPLDLLVTHSPAYGLNDGKDPAHTGFKIFNFLLESLKPRFFIHGHVHLNYGDYPRLDRYGQTIIINAYQNYLLEYVEKEHRNSFSLRRFASEVFEHEKNRFF